MSNEDYSVGTKDKVYFAANEDPVEVAKAIWARKRNYERYVRDTGLFSLWRKMHWAYHGREDGTNFRTTEVGSDGPQGEIHVLKVNHLRSIMTSWDSLLSAQRTAVTPVALDDDYESEMHVKRAKAMLEHYISAGSPAQLELTEVEVRESACLYGAGFGVQLWNPMKGPIAVAPAPGETGPARKGGDLQSWALTPLDVAYDPWRKDTRNPWYLCRLWYNKYALIGRWPEYTDQILGLSPEPESEFLDFTLSSAGSAPPGKFSQDEIPLYYFCHDQMEAPGMERGKQGFLLSGDIMLEYGELRYRGRDGTRFKPVHRLSPADIKRTPHGFSPAWELMAPQEAIDSLSSIQLTNSRAFGLGSMMAPKGGDIEPVQLSEGLQLVEYTQGMDKPEFLKVPETSPTIPGQRHELVGEMGIIIGVNGAFRGDPSATVDKSGSALALLDAKAVQANSPFISRSTRWKEEFYLSTVCIVQQEMSEPRKFAIIGEAIATLTEAFGGEGIDRILKVKIQTVNPLSHTIAGRAQIADTIAERYGNATTPGDYFRLLESGNGDFLTHHADQKERNIDRENQLLAQGIGPVPMQPRMLPDGQPLIDPETGKPEMVPAPVPGKRYVRALMTDDHRHHVRLHLSVLDNPAVREQNSQQAKAVVEAVLSHIEEHKQLLGKMTLKDPGMLEMTGQPPLQAALPPPMPGAPPPPGVPPRPPGAPTKDVRKLPGGTPTASVEQPTPAGAGQQPRMPSMPINPSTGRRAPGPPPPPAHPPGMPPGPPQ